MMKGFLVFGIVLLMSVSFVSAYSFNDLVDDVISSIKGRFTGHAVSEEKSVMVNENNRASLSCDSGQVIKSVEALYWCPDGTGRSALCPTSGAIGESSYYFDFRSSNCGGDPCRYVSKRGNLTIGCGTLVCSDYTDESECVSDSLCEWAQGPSVGMLCQDKTEAAAPAAKVAGSGGNILGCIEDAQGIPLPGAVVRVQNTLLGGSAGGDGCFIVEGTADGSNYDLEITLTNYHTEYVSVKGGGAVVVVMTRVYEGEETTVEESVPHAIVEASYEENFDGCITYGNSDFSDCSEEVIRVHNGDSVEFDGSGSYFEGLPIDRSRINWYYINHDLDVFELEGILDLELWRLEMPGFLDSVRFRRGGVDVNIENTNIQLRKNRINVLFSFPIGLGAGYEDKQYVILEVSDFDGDYYDYYIQEISVGCYDTLRECETAGEVLAGITGGDEEIGVSESLSSAEIRRLTFRSCDSNDDCSGGWKCNELEGKCAPRDYSQLSCKLSSGRGATVRYEGRSYTNPFYGNPLFKQVASASPLHVSSCVDEDTITVMECTPSGVEFREEACPAGTTCEEDRCVDPFDDLVERLKEVPFGTHEAVLSGLYVEDEASLRYQRTFQDFARYLESNPKRINGLEIERVLSSPDFEKNAVIVLGITNSVNATEKLIDMVKTSPSGEIRSLAAGMLRGHVTRNSFHLRQKVFIDNTYLIVSNDPEITPAATLQLMRRNRFFSIIETFAKEQYGLEGNDATSTSFVAFRELLEEYNLPEYGFVPDEGPVEGPIVGEIQSTLESIIDKKQNFESEVILGSEKYFVLFGHEDPNMLFEEVLSFARERGVTRFNPTTFSGPGHDLRVYPVDGFRGPDAKGDITDVIVDSKMQGETTIWIEAHGLSNYVCLGGGIPAEQVVVGEDSSCFGFRYDEFADILLDRGDLQEVTLIISSCFSYDFAEQLIDSLEEKGSSSFPTIVTISNKGKYGYIGALIGDLRALNLMPGEPLFGGHIYALEARQQDSAIFFSRDRSQPSEEIAMNLFNHDCSFCTGDYCSITSDLYGEIPEESSSTASITISADNEYLFSTKTNCVSDLSLIFSGDMTDYTVTETDNLVAQLDGDLLSFYPLAQGSLRDELIITGCNDFGDCESGTILVESAGSGSLFSSTASVIKRITGMITRRNAETMCTQPVIDLYIELANAERPYYNQVKTLSSGPPGVEVRGTFLDTSTGSALLKLEGYGNVGNEKPFYNPGWVDMEGIYETDAYGKDLEKIKISAARLSGILGKSVSEDVEYFVVVTSKDYYIRTSSGILELERGLYLIPLNYNVRRSTVTEYESNKLSRKLQAYESSAGYRNHVTYLDLSQAARFLVPAEAVPVPYEYEKLSYYFVSLDSTSGEFAEGDYLVPREKKITPGKLSLGHISTDWRFNTGKMNNFRAWLRSQSSPGEWIVSRGNQFVEWIATGLIDTD